MTPRSRDSWLGPLAEASFRRFYLARALSLFGDALVPVALAFGVLSVDASPAALGSVLASQFVSLVVFVLLAGVIADRLPRRGILIASDLLRLTTQATTAVLLIRGIATVPQLIVLAFVYGLGEAFFRPTVTGFVPQTVAAELLQHANAMISTTNSACAVLGPVVAGALIATVGSGWAIAVDASTFLASAVLLAGVRTVSVPNRAQGRLLHDLVEGWRTFRARTWLWVDGVYSALANFAVFAPFLALGPIVAVRSLGGAGAWASIVAAFGIGSILGGVALLRFRPHRPLLIGVPLLAMLALPTALLAVPASTVAIALGAFAGGLGLSVFNTLFETTLQQLVPADTLSRVASIDWLLSLGLFPLGLALSGSAAAAFGIRAPLIGGAVWIVASTAVVLTIPSVRQLRVDAKDTADRERE